MPTKAELLKMSREELREYARQVSLARRIPMTMRSAIA